MVRQPDTVLKRAGELARRPLPTPPPWLRRGPWRADAFRSPVRGEWLTARLGVALGLAFGICFVTGLISHYIQHPTWWWYWPSRPVNLYRVTQGLHVATGLAAIPLLLAKLWSAYPRLFTWPPARDLVHAVERASIAVLVASAVFQLLTGLLNVARWYGPMPFFFTVAHYGTAWIAAGALLVHIGVKLPVIRRALRRRAAPGQSTVDKQRRGVLVATAAAVTAVTLTTAGQTLRPLAPLDLFGQRRPDLGPQRLPVNKSAVAARVTDRARDPDYRLTIVGPHRTIQLSLADLRVLPQHTVGLPISCVEGWSADAEWGGVRVRELLDSAGIPTDAAVRVDSLQPEGLYRASTLAPPHSRDPLTLLALRVNGEVLHLDHGFPCRIIAPNRPGVLQTKWVSRIAYLPRDS